MKRVKVRYLKIPLRIVLGPDHIAHPRYTQPIVTEGKDGEARFRKLIYRLDRILESHHTFNGKPICNYVYILDRRTVPKELKANVR